MNYFLFQIYNNHSLSYFGVRLFNVLPKNIRDHSGSIEFFKNLLDRYLLGLPDQPNVPGYKSMLAASSNSIIDQAQYKKIDSRH